MTIRTPPPDKRIIQPAPRFDEEYFPSAHEAAMAARQARETVPTAITTTTSASSSAHSAPLSAEEALAVNYANMDAIPTSSANLPLNKSVSAAASTPTSTGNSNRYQGLTNENAPAMDPTLFNSGLSMIQPSNPEISPDLNETVLFRPKPTSPVIDGSVSLLATAHHMGLTNKTTEVPPRSYSTIDSASDSGNSQAVQAATDLIKALPLLGGALFIPPSVENKRTVVDPIVGSALSAGRFPIIGGGNQPFSVEQQPALDDVILQPNPANALSKWFKFRRARRHHIINLCVPNDAITKQNVTVFANDSELSENLTALGVKLDCMFKHQKSLWLLCKPTDEISLLELEKRKRYLQKYCNRVDITYSSIGQELRAWLLRLVHSHAHWLEPEARQCLLDRFEYTPGQIEFAATSQASVSSHQSSLADDHGIRRIPRHHAQFELLSTMCSYEVDAQIKLIDNACQDAILLGFPYDFITQIRSAIDTLEVFLPCFANYPGLARSVSLKKNQWQQIPFKRKRQAIIKLLLEEAGTSVPKTTESPPTGNPSPSHVSEVDHAEEVEILSVHQAVNAALVETIPDISNVPTMPTVVAPAFSHITTHNPLHQSTSATMFPPRSLRNDSHVPPPGAAPLLISHVGSVGAEQFHTQGPRLSQQASPGQEYGTIAVSAAPRPYQFGESHGRAPPTPVFDESILHPRAFRPSQGVSLSSHVPAPSAPAIAHSNRQRSGFTRPRVSHSKERPRNSHFRDVPVCTAPEPTNDTFFNTVPESFLSPREQPSSVCPPEPVKTVPWQDANLTLLTENDNSASIIPPDLSEIDADYKLHKFLQTDTIPVLPSDARKNPMKFMDWVQRMQAFTAYHLPNKSAGEVARFIIHGAGDDGKHLVQDLSPAQRLNPTALYVALKDSFLPSSVRAFLRQKIYHWKHDQGTDVVKFERQFRLLYKNVGFDPDSAAYADLLRAALCRPLSAYIAEVDYMDRRYSKTPMDRRQLMEVAAEWQLRQPMSDTPISSDPLVSTLTTERTTSLFDDLPMGLPRQLRPIQQVVSAQPSTAPTNEALIIGPDISVCSDTESLADFTYSPEFGFFGDQENIEKYLHSEGISTPDSGSAAILCAINAINVLDQTQEPISRDELTRVARDLLTTSTICSFCGGNHQWSTCYANKDCADRPARCEFCTQHHAAPCKDQDSADYRLDRRQMQFAKARFALRKLNDRRPRTAPRRGNPRSNSTRPGNGQRRS